MNLFAAPLLIFALLNAVLAFSAPRRVASPWPALAFGAAALCLGVGLLLPLPALVLLGGVLSLVGPVLMGFLLHGKPTLSHHVVRGVLVALCYGLWITHLTR